MTRAGDEFGVGIQLPVQAQSTIFVEPWESDAGPRELTAITRAAEEHGYLYVGVCDHVAIPTDKVERMGATWYEPLSTLAWLAGHTERIRLLTHVYVVALRPRMLTAKAVATLDRLSSGRVIFGVGAGHVEKEFAALGRDFDSRGQATDDAIRALRDAWAGGGPDGFVMDPGPVQVPVPLWIGGSSPRALRRAGELGDGWLPQGTPLKDMATSIASIRAAAEATGRDPATIAIGGMTPPMYVGQAPWDVGKHTVADSADRLAGLVEKYKAIGCSHVQVRLRSRSAEELIDQLAVFSAEVLAPLGALTVGTEGSTASD